MLRGTTKSGFEYEITDDQLDNYELLEVMAEVDTQPLLVPKMVDMMLGKEQKKRLFDHVRDEHGKVATTAISKEMEEILKAGKLKNS